MTENALENYLNLIEHHGFKPLTTGDRDIFFRYYDLTDDYWCYTLCFTTLISWQEYYPVFFREYEGLLIFFVWDSLDGNFYLYPPLGHYEKNAVAACIEEAKSLFDDLGQKLYLIDVSEWMLPYIKTIEKVSWEITDDQGFFDYIYKRDDFEKSMETRERSYNYNYFVRKYAPETIELKIADADECVALCEKVWCTSHDCKECYEGCCLKNVIKKAVSNIDQINAWGILVRSENEPIAYCVVSKYKGMGVYHFKKTARGFRGINEYLHRECFYRFLDGVEIINYTEDLGSEGLRKYKSRLAPHTLSKRYRLTMH